MTTLLVGDIGGTKTILRLVSAEPTQTVQDVPRQTTLHEQVYASQEFLDLVPMVREFLTDATETLGSTPTPTNACFGIAGPVVNNTSKLTNLRWFLDADRLKQELQLQQVRLINDFVAVGYGVTGLSKQDVFTLQQGTPDITAPIGVIGAGTGLGQGFLIPHPGGFQVFGTEGGHADFAPRSELEFQLMQYLLETYNIDRVSVERVVSGMGIAGIYQFLRDRHASQESPALTKAYETWKQELGQDEKTVDLAAEISNAAINQLDPLCQQTMEVFVKAYGAEAGNLALKLLPYGGLYIAGGIAVKILPLMQQGSFLQAFLRKGRMTTLLEQVPIHVVLGSNVGLLGAAVCAAQLTSS